MARRPPERTMGAAVSALSAGLAVPGSGLGQSMYGLPADAPRISFIAVDDISANPQQPRRSIDARNQEELAASIARIGLLQPILVRTAEPGGEGRQWVIVAGERRWRAVKALGQPKIAAVVTGRDPDEAALIENVQRQDLHPVDLARAVERLAERHRYTQEELAAAIGKSQGEISKLMRILTLPASLLDEAALLPEVTRAALYRLAITEAAQQEALWLGIKGGSGVEASDGSTMAEDSETGGSSRRRATKSDLMSRAIAGLGARIEKCNSDGLTDDQRERLRALRDAIDALLSGEPQNIPEE